MNRFDRDTEVRRTGDGRFEARIDPGWHVVRGPNGGYVAALILRALEAATDDPERAARSLTVHYTAPPREGPVTIEARVERSGRSLTTLSARMLQEHRLVALALGAFSRPRRTLEFDDSRPPRVAPPEACAPLEQRIPIHERYEQRLALGAPPFSGGDRALAGGWIRLADGPRAPDAALVAALADAWPPAIFGRISQSDLAGGVPTVDLTVHFRGALPPATFAPDDFALVVFRSRLAREGFLEEDGEVWTPDGVLLAQSRQLAVVV